TDWGEIKRLLPFGVIGASFGVFALLRFPSAPILVALACFTIFFGMRNALGIQPKGHISALWALPTGLIGSGAGALFGTSAPPYIIYLTHRLEDKTAVRATFSWLFVLDGGFRLILFVAAGLLLDRNTQLAITMGLVPMIAGLYMGNRVHLDISRERLLQVIGWILVGAGVSLILKVML
ncbi:MAG: TSUP family transporter, partial [Rhodospirillaceae bacterium]